MREFFKGWRRKTGCVLLVMACGVMICWVRSKLVEDTLIVIDDRDYYNFVSDEFGMRVVYDRGPEETSTIVWVSQSYAGGQVRRYAHPLDRNNPGSRWSVCGIHFGSQDGMPNYFVCVIPYWYLVVPLTLLSAYLILWKPRPKVERDA